MLIDSQKVIDIIEKHKSYGINGILENIVEDIDNFCSGLENMGLNINKEQEPCDDAISRQAVLDGIEELKQSPWFNDDTHESKIIRKETVEIVEDLCVKQLPLVRPQEPKTGHWNCGDDMFEYAICSSCKHETGEAWEYAKRNFKYCPNCGAKMESER